MNKNKKMTVGKVFYRLAMCILNLIVLILSLIVLVSCLSLFGSILETLINLVITAFLTSVFIVNMVILGHNIEQYFKDNRKDNNII